MRAKKIIGEAQTTKQIVPSYYTTFRCLADKCFHTCCRGWEIDVDADSLARYERTPGPLGEKLRREIAVEDGGASFRLDAEERCPFLRRDGLCELICQLGEGALCQVCADHPRFRSFFSDRTETGLGLCCEAAARLVLLEDAPMTLLVLAEDGGNEAPDAQESALLCARARLLALVQDRARPLPERLGAVLDAAHASLPARTMAQWAGMLRELEVLDPAWRGELAALAQAADAPLSPSEQEMLARPLEQLCAYLLFRHLPGALEDGRVSARAAFAVLSTQLLSALCASRRAATGSLTLEDLLDLARMYSAEIEYSEENLSALLDACEGT